MKTKLVMLISLGTLALAANVPNAMATSVKTGSSVRRVEAVRKSTPAIAPANRQPKKAAVPSHTIHP